MASAWTAEGEEIVRQWYGFEKVEQIIPRLKAVGQVFTRCAIIGKAGRLGLYAQKKGRGEKRPRGEKRLPKVAKPAVRKKFNTDFGNPTSNKPTAPVVMHLPQSLPSDARLLGLEDLDAVMTLCRYPLGDETIRFCGGQTSPHGGSYCEHHSVICNKEWPPKNTKVTPAGIRRQPLMVCQPYDGPVSAPPMVETPLTEMVIA